MTAPETYTPFGGLSRVLRRFDGATLPRPSRIDCYAASLAAVALLLLTTVVLNERPLLNAPLWTIVVLGLIALAAERQPVRVAANLEMTVSVLPTIFAAVVYGPLAAMLVVVIGLAGDIRRPYARWVIWTSSRSIGAGLGGIAAAALLRGDNSFGRLVAAVMGAAVIDALVEACLGGLTVSLRGTGSFRTFTASIGRILLGTVPLYTPVITVLVYAYSQLSTWTLVLFVAPSIAAHSLYRLYRQERDTSEQLKQSNVRLERANLSFASALVSALDARDSYTAGHSAAVAVYARDIAERLGLSVEEQQRAHLCGLLHDIGKVGLPPTILEKTGPLSLEERRQMEEHATIGERILVNVEDYGDIAMVVRHHHERLDGNGYPDRLVGDDIPLLSRIIAVADAYNAMTSGRPYRDAMPSRVARLRLAQAVETQFDTTVVAAFEAVLAGAGTTYLSGARADFAVEAQRHPVFSARAAEALA